MERLKGRVKQLLIRMKKMNDNDVDHGESELSSPAFEIKEIATLKAGIFRSLTPMLEARFEFCSRWTNARLSQDWLDLKEIANAINDPNISESVNLRIENWDFVPPASVGLENCAIFSYNPYEPDETYLVWEEGKEEPSVWEFFGGDYATFDNLENYLSYIVGDRESDDTVKDPLM